MSDLTAEEAAATRFVARSEEAARKSGVEHFFAQLNMRDVEVAGYDLSMEMPTGPHLTNARGGLQGGLIATMTDIVAGRLALRGLPADGGVATSNINIHYLAPVMVGPALAHGTVLRRGSRTVLVQVDVYDAGREMLHAASSTLTFSVMRPRGLST